MAHSTSASTTPTWTYLEPLYISNNGSFSAGRNNGTCSPIDPIFGIWYIALNSFTLPTSASTLPSCKIGTTAPWQGWAVSKKRAASASGTPSTNLYIVEVSANFFSSKVTPIAGPVGSSASTWYFQPMESSLSFSAGNLYSFFVASYSGPALAQPGVSCIAGSTSCSLGSNPTPGNKIVAVVSDGSGQLPNMVVQDSAGNTLTQETISPNCGHCVAVYDETVPAGITNTLSYTNAGSPIYPNVSTVYELAGVTAGQFISANTTGVPSSFASTISNVTNGDVQLCAYIQTGSSTGNITLAFSNGTSETYDSQSPGAVFAHEIATANASSTCTANNINADYQAALGFADYY